MRVVATLLISLVGNSVWAQAHSLVWDPDYRLVLADFHRKLPPSSANDALSAVGIRMGHHRNGDVLLVTVEAVFSRNGSRAKENLANEAVLKHEQLHFDITELYARKLRQQISNASFEGNKRKVIKKISAMQRSTKAELEQVHDLYDEETTLPSNPEMQRKWEEKIAVELEQLKAFSNPVIEIRP